MTAPNQLPGSPTAGSNDLRDRIASAIRDAADKHLPICDEDGCECDIAIISPMYGNGQTARVEGSPEGLADAVMAVVRPEIDAKDMETERLRTQSCPGCMAREQERDAWAEAARQTGVKSVEYKRSIDAWRKRAEAAEERLNDIREEGRDL